MLAIDQLAIHLHIEDSTFAFNQLSLDTGRLENLSSQTGRLWFVVSHYAIGNFDLQHVNIE